MNFQIRQEKFEGPLELLYDLIERKELGISEVSLSKVADEYLMYVRSLEAIDPERLAQFLVVAAQLMLLKSRTLLPSLEIPDDEEESIDELQQRLKEYALIRECAKEVQKMIEARARMHAREAYYGFDAVFYPPPRLTAASFPRVFVSVLSLLPKKEVLAEEKMRRVLTLEEKAEHVRAFLQGSLERSFADLVGSAKDKVEIIVSFLALLELARQKFLELKQEKLFDDITIKKYDSQINP